MRHLLRLSFCLLLVICATLSVAQPRREPLTLLRVTPAGDDVPLSTQLVFEFSRPMVPLGRMERRAEEIPITVTPALPCTWRWLNTTTLACELGERTPMARATRYTITVRPGIQTEDGVTLTAPVTHTFFTQRPKVTDVRHQTWVAPGTPELLVMFDQPVTSSAITRHVYISVSSKKRVAISASEAPKHKGRGWLIRPVEELPQDVSVAVWVEPGVVSTQGREPGNEQRAIYPFDTLPPLRVLGLSCISNTGQATTIPILTKQPPQQWCDPQQLALLFSAPVQKEGAQQALRFTPALPGAEADDPWENASTGPGLAQPHQRGRRYELPLPDLQWGKTYRLQAAPRQIKDAFGRRLTEAIDIQFTTEHRRPEFVLRHEISVLEQQVDTHLPLEVLNLQAVHLRYETLTTRGHQVEQEHTMPLNLEIDTSYLVPLKVRDLLPAASGVIQGKLHTTPMVGDEPAWFFSQVTPFSVHVKVGHHNTLAWVTTFDTGLPVPDVRVQLTSERLEALREQPKVLAEARTNADGLATLGGLSTLYEAIGILENWGSPMEPRVFVRLQKDDAMALVPLVYEFQVEAYGPNRSYISESLEFRYGHIRAWGTTPQGVYRAGDTVQFKLYVRDQDNERFVPAPRTGYTLQVIDPTGKVVHDVRDVRLSEFGAYHGEFAVPQNGAVGWYRFVLSADFAQHSVANRESEGETRRTWEPMRVLISDFTPAPFRVTTDLHGTTLVTPEAPVTVTTQAQLHAGGPYGAAEVRLTASVQGRPLVPQEAQAAHFYFSVSAPPTPADAAAQEPDSETDAEAAEDPEAAEIEAADKDTVSETLHEVQERLDDSGLLETTFVMPAAKVLYGQLRVESAVRDDRGKSVAGYATAHYAGRDRYVGLYQADWLLTSGTPAQLQALVVNEHGAAVAGTPIQVQVMRLEIKAAQVKGAGNAYLPHYVRHWEDVATCTLVSEPTPGVCTFTPQTPGVYKMTASIVDTQGRVHSTTIRRWVSGAGDVLWETSPDHALTILPEQKSYKVGDTARYLVQNPFPGAKALVTIERLGVQRSWLETLNEAVAIIEVPITPHHIPGFYLSVVVMSPRVDKPLGENQVDLGKPTFRMGYVRTLVPDVYKELVVTVRPHQEVYKPRQTAMVDLHVSTRQGERLPVELAVAVLDESVFDLIAGGRDYFDPYRGFYTLEALDLRNYNLLKQLIGRQKFDKKGANPGGDGGLDLDLRSLFKFVSYWNPALIPDAEGKATIAFELPDNLTGWRVLAMAVTPDDRMGLGEGHFKANKPTEIRPALPNQVTAGDRFDASFTILNRTDAPRTLAVTLSATGSPLQESAGMRQILTAEPYKRYLMRLPVETTHAGEVRLRVHAGDGQDQDALEVPLLVSRPGNQALRVAATYGSTTASEVQQTVVFPLDMRTDVGQVSVVATPTVIGGLEGVFTYLRDYPYACWEQKLTTGVMAAHYQALGSYVDKNFRWPESQALPQQTLAMAANYQAPNGGMTYYIPQEQYVSPDLSAYTALAFTWLRARGYTVPATVETRLHEYLLAYLRQDRAPDFYSHSMRATVYAMALAALAPHGKVSREELDRYHAHVKEMSLFGKAHYLLALTQAADTVEMQAEVLDLIRAHANETSGKLVYSEEVDAAYQRLLYSSLRTNCAILSALVAHDTTRPGGTAPSDVPSRLVRAITQTRQNRTHWSNTQENMFCLNALIDFSQAYEREEPRLTLRAALDNVAMGEARMQGYQAPAVDFQRPIQPEDAGRQATLTLTREGQGRVYYAMRLFYAPTELQSQALNAGIEVHREYSVERGRGWVKLESPMHLRLGELVRVDLYISLPAARHFVVVDDPVPGGLEPVNRDLATASKTDADKATVPYAAGSWWFRYNDWRAFGTTRWSFYHKELRHHAVRFYSEYLPAGRYHLAYVAQAIAPGEFAVPPLRAEEMYNPETYGLSAPATLRVLRIDQHEARQ